MPKSRYCILHYELQQTTSTVPAVLVRNSRYETKIITNTNDLILSSEKTAGSGKLTAVRCAAATRPPSAARGGGAPGPEPPRRQRRSARAACRTISP